MFIIGIAGGSGAGKSTFVKKVIEDLAAGQVILIRQDSYYKDNSHVPPEQRQKINFDHPSSIEFDLLEDHLLRMITGEETNQPVYSFKTCTREKEPVRVRPAKLAVLEGILILTSPSLRKLIDLKVFIDTCEDERLARIIYRDLHERGRTAGQVRKRYHKTVKPMHDQYIEPSKQFADIIVPGGGDNLEGINLIRAIIKQNTE